LAAEGVLTLRDEVSPVTIHPIIDAILDHNLRGGRDQIRLYITSSGGDVDLGFALIDIMRWSRIPIHTTAMGMVGSMALLIAMAGSRGHRTVMPNCSLLSHRFFSGSIGSHADLVAARVQQDIIHRRIIEHYRICTGESDPVRLESDLLGPTDRWLTPVEAVRYGLMDRVWTPETP
jgi:ATP-dependent Clp protease protease subunit